MGNTIWVDVQDRAKGDHCPPDNSIMLQMKKQLDQLAGQLGVRKLSDFYEYSVLENELFRPLAMFLRWIRDLFESGGLQSKELWFDPEPALAAVRAIHGHLEQHPADLGFQGDTTQPYLPAHLMEELQHCQTVLEEATSQGRKFRFLIVP